jgi:hypothetical protein
MEPSEGDMLTEAILLAFDGAPVTDGGFVPPLGSEEPAGAVEPVGSVEEAVLIDCTALAGEPVPPPHPEPQKAKVISKVKKRKNGKLCG